MAKKKINHVSATADDSAELLEFKNALRSKLEEILASWVNVGDGGTGYEHIFSWLKLSQEDISAALKSNQNNAATEKTPTLTYIALLRQLSSSLKKVTACKKAQIMDRCVNHHDVVQDVIKDFMERRTKLEEDCDASDAEIANQLSEDGTMDLAISKQNKRKFESTTKKSSKKKPKLEETDMVATGQQNSVDEGEKKYLETIPDDIKQVFREVGFAKWSKDWIPVLVLSPYDVDLALRETWKKKYKKFESKKGPMEHIVYWYGTKNPQDYYGFVTDFMYYEDAEKKGYHKPPKRLEQKVANGKKLTGPEQAILIAFEEIELARKMSKAERWDRKSLLIEPEQGVKERINDDIKEIELQDSVEENHAVRPIQKRKKRAAKEKTKLEGKNESLEAVPVPPKNKELSKGCQKIGIVNDIEFDAEDSEEERATDDEKYEDSEPKLKLKKNQKGKGQLQRKEKIKPPKGSERIEKPSTKKYTATEEQETPQNEAEALPLLDDSKEEPSAEDFTAIEEQEFYKNESEILPLMDKLDAAISKNNSEEACTNLSEILRILHSITPSFIEVHGIGKLLKRTRKTFDEHEGIKTKVKTITTSMKVIYTEKTAKRPASFKRTWGDKREQYSIQEESKNTIDAVEVASTPSKAVVNKSPSPEPVELQNVAAIADVVPRKGGTATETQTSAVPQPAVDVKIPAPIKPKKTKFSLGAMIDGTKQTSAPSTGLPLVSRESRSSLAASNVLAINKKVPPKWLTDTLPNDMSDPTVGDEVRSLGKEFIEAIDADWPDEILEQINFRSFVYHIEMAIYEWSQKDQAAIANSSRRVSVKTLKYPENYWIKVRDIVSGLTGDQQVNKPKLVEWMLRGDYETPMDLVKLPGVTFYESMKNFL